MRVRRVLRMVRSTVHLAMAVSTQGVELDQMARLLAMAVRIQGGELVLIPVGLRVVASLLEEDLPS